MVRFVSLMVTALALGCTAEEPSARTQLEFRPTTAMPGDVVDVRYSDGIVGGDPCPAGADGTLRLVFERGPAVEIEMDCGTTEFVIPFDFPAQRFVRVDLVVASSGELLATIDEPLDIVERSAEPGDPDAFVAESLRVHEAQMRIFRAGVRDTETDARLDAYDGAVRALLDGPEGQSLVQELAELRRHDVSFADRYEAWLFSESSVSDFGIYADQFESLAVQFEVEMPEDRRLFQEATLSSLLDHGFRRTDFGQFDADVGAQLLAKIHDDQTRALAYATFGGFQAIRLALFDARRIFLRRAEASFADARIVPVGDRDQKTYTTTVSTALSPEIVVTGTSGFLLGVEDVEGEVSHYDDEALAALTRSYGFFRTRLETEIKASEPDATFANALYLLPPDRVADATSVELLSWSSYNSQVVVAEPNAPIWTPESQGATTISVGPAEATRWLLQGDSQTRMPVARADEAELTVIAD